MEEAVLPYQRVTIRGNQQALHHRISIDDTKRLAPDLKSETNQQTGTRELPTDLRSETNQRVTNRS